MTSQKIFHSFCTLFTLLFFSYVAIAQRSWLNADYIPISINSGNPSFPYPQFLEYAKGKTLAKYNAEGVTHADMEKAGREAYEIMTHRCRYDGGTHCGVPYITYNNFVKLGTVTLPQGGAEFCSEGDGYMLLAAAIFADQPTFNGLWMWVHDNRLSKVKKYSDGSWLRQGYVVNNRLVCKDPEAGIGMPGWNCFADDGVGSSPTHSAADGDYDIAMALLIAYKQWGEFMYQNGVPVKDGEGNQISYKKAAQDFIKSLVDTVPYYTANGGKNGYLTGDIGVDGYPKGGNSWGELTNWRTTQTDFDPKLCEIPSMGGGGGGASYVDYNAPAYFNEFAHWLENEDGEGTPWQINQFKRAEASSDWVAGQLYAQGGIASVGKYQINANNTVTFSAFNAGEDFRFGWRHILNYLWHGNPTTTWNPTTHAVEPGENTFEKDLAMQHAEFMKEPRNGATVTCAKMGASPDPGQPSWSGPAQIRQSYFMDGGIQDASGSNYALGCSAPAAVASEDLSFVADMYRQSEIVWDDASGSSNSLSDDERYILSMPKYFHGWFRNLGMLTNSGNLHAPRNMTPKANMKVYMSVDKTYAYESDKVTYTVQYRNYGSAEAKGVTIVTELDPNYEFVSANKGAVISGNTLTWNIGSVAGFKTGALASTIDSVQFTVRVKGMENPRICLTSVISGNNFEDWVSNEFPNNATYTMERNCVDILANRSLFVKKTANRTSLNPNDVVTFTVDFGNKSEGEESWLNGGRDNVRISYGNHYQTGNAYQFYQLYRFWNDSYEAYINMNNYRVSYFMYDAAAIGLYDNVKNQTGWTFVVDNQNDLDKYGYNPEAGPITFAYQKIPQGENENGKWNQRLMIRFADVLMAPSTHVYDKLDSKYLLHKGVYGPGFIRARLASNPAQDLSKRVEDDWSFSLDVKENSLDGQGTTFTLISPCWADYNNLGYEITNYSRHVCDPTSADNYGRILVEEYDGYTWRRIQGTGPLPGKEAYNVVIADTIPYELEWVDWVDKTALKNDSGERIEATYTPAANPQTAGYTGIVHWTIPEMLVGESDKLSYRCKARDLGCPTAVDTYYENAAWIWSDTDSPDSSKVDLLTTCAELPPVIDPQTSLFKTADKTKVEVGDVISYELEFINTEGTRVDANCKSTTNWKALGTGRLPAISSEGLKLSTDGMGSYFFAPEKSYGKDGEVYATFGSCTNSTQSLFIVMRYVSGTPGQADFKGVCMQMMINKDGKNNFGYYLYNDATLIASEGFSWADAMQFPGNNEAPTFKFVLNGDKLYMYVNDAEDEWTNVSKDWSGLSSAGPGYFGMYVNSNGNSNTALTSFVTKLDYAFDITLFDKIPAELGNITNVSDAGNWDASKNYITWPTIATTAATALPPNASIVYSFDAEVVTCEKYINNYGLAKILGIDTLKVVHTAECGTPTSCATMPKATISGGADYCLGDEITPITIEFTNGSAPYTFSGSGIIDGVEELYTNVSTVGANTSIKVGSLPGEVGKHSYRITHIKDANDCEVVFSKPLGDTITVHSIPEAEIVENGTSLEYCENGGGVELSLSKEISGASYEWFKNTVSLGEKSLTANALSNVEAGEYYCEISQNGCIHQSALVEVIEHTLPTYVISGGGTYCPSADDKKAIEVKFTSNNLPITFEMVGVNCTSEDDGTYTFENPIGDLAPGLEYIPTNIKDSKGCEGISADSEFVIDLPIIGLSTQTIADVCLASTDKISIADYVFADDGINKPTEKVEYEIPEGGKGSVDKNTGELTISTTEAATYSVVAKLTGTSAAGCALEKILTVNVLDLPKVVISASNVCFGNNLELAADVNGDNGLIDSKYSWTIAPKGEAIDNSLLNSTSLATPTIESTTPAGIYTVSLVVEDDKNCKSIITEQDVTIFAIPEVKLLAEKQEFCVGESAEIITATSTITGGVGTWCSNASNTSNSAAEFNPITASNKTTVTYNYVSAIADGACAVEATIDLKVHALPEFTITPSNANICVVDALNENQEITITTDLATTAGTFKYSGAVGINETTGTFNSKNQTAGVLTIDLEYIDENLCANTASSIITVHSAPMVEFLTSNATEVCAATSDNQLYVNPVADNITTFGSFSGANSDGSFTSKLDAGKQSFTYTYTDVNGCVGAETYSVEVKQVSAPAPIAKVVQIDASNNLTNTTELIASIPENADNIQWFNESDCNGTSILTGEIFMTNKTVADVDKSFTYGIRAIKTIEGGVCFSNCVNAVLSLTKCPAQQPIAKNPHFCESAASDISVTATQATPLTLNSYLAWFDEHSNPIGQKGENPVGFLQKGNSYSVTNGAETAGSYKYYVAEFDATNNCWSAGTLVTMTVNENPELEIIVDAEFCATEKIIPFTLKPEPTTFNEFSYTQIGTSYGGFDAENFRWDAMFGNSNPPAEQEIEVEYKAIKIFGTSANEISVSCEGTTTTRTKAYFTEAPQTFTNNWLINDIERISNNFMQAELSGSGIFINWYDNSLSLISEGLKTPLNINKHLNLDKIALQNEVKDFKTYRKVYNITQTNDFGCESKATEVYLDLVDCPFKAPETTNNAVCEADITNTGIALLAQNIDNSVVPEIWNWYSAIDDITEISSTTSGNSSSFFAIDKSTKTYYVSYVAKELNSGQMCESPRTAVTITVHKNPEITELKSRNILCYDSPIETVTAEINSESINDLKYLWNIQGESAEITTSTFDFNPAFKGEKTDIYTLNLAIEDGNKCRSELSKSIAVQFVPKPVAIHYNEAPDVLKTVQVAADNLETIDFEQVRWYASNVPSDTDILSTNNPFATGDNPTVQISAENPKKYYVSQVVQGCESERAEALVTIICPEIATPTLVGGSVCFGEANIELTANSNTSALITWYNIAGIKIGSGNNYTPTETQQGSYKYYATQTENGCESEKVEVEFIIQELPTAPIISIEKTAICEYESEPKISAVISNATSVKWYSAANKSNHLTQFDGITTITANRNINSTLNYFATQTINGCTSDFSNGVQYSITNAVAAPSTIDAAMCENESNIPALKSSSTHTRWYTTEVLLPNLPSETPLTIGSSYIPQEVTESTTFYVQNVINNCLSPMVPVTMHVVSAPIFSIESNIGFCDYDSTIIEATNIVPAPTSTSHFSWLLSNNDASFTKLLNSTSHSITLSNEIVPTHDNYNLQVQYTYSYANIICVSQAQNIALAMYKRPNPPIAVSKTVCQGVDLEPLQAFGSPLIQWIFKSGTQTLPDWVGETYDFNKFNYNEIAIGKYEFELFDTDAETSCISNSTTLNFEIASAAETKIIGRNALCEGEGIEEPYHIERVPKEESQYYWETSGSVSNYSKDNNPYSSSRYVDWLSQGIDTLYVRERTQAGCEGYDTLVVTIARKPIAYYTWHLPGASTSIEFMDSSFQAPIESVYDKSIAPIEVGYSMKWNFDLHSTDNVHEDLFLQYEDRNKPVLIENYSYGNKYPELTVINDYGCSDSYSTEIFIDIQSGIYIPNAFSPGNAAQSVRVFKPVAFNLEYCKLWIYDKWGNLLFYSEEVQDGSFVGEWSGTYDGEMLPNDVYIWKMDAKFLDGTIWKGIKKPIGYSKFGNVTLLR